MLRLDDAWVWDSWPLYEPADEQHPWHLFFLHAPRTLADPELRHANARIGHAASVDLTAWTRLPDVVGPGGPGTADAVATWTGCTLRAPDGRWHTYYTGMSRDPADPVSGGEVQRVLRAVSDDLLTWRKDPAMGPVDADPRWYARLGDSQAWPDEHWRDPWVFADPGGAGWHMLVTARARPDRHPDLEADDLGVLGHAWSADLDRWEVGPPRTEPGSGFGQLEVPQVATVAGTCWLVFSCLPAQLAGWQRARHGWTGHWVVRAVDPAGPYDASAAVPLTDGSLYAGRLVETDDGPHLLAFDNVWGPDRGGSIGPPVPVPVHPAATGPA